MLDRERNTPLDSLVLRIIKGYIVDFAPAYASICLLAQHGAKLHNVSADEWHTFLDHCARQGADRSVFQACGQPQWVERSSVWKQAEQESKPKEQIQVKEGKQKKGRRGIMKFISKFSRS